MSLEAWGDEGDQDDYDHLLEAGWWTSEQVAELQAQVKALRSEPLYEGGQYFRGVSVKFLARISLLTAAAGLDVAPDILAEAQRLCAEDEPATENPAPEPKTPRTWHMWE